MRLLAGQVAIVYHRSIHGASKVFLYLDNLIARAENLYPQYLPPANEPNYHREPFLHALLSYAMNLILVASFDLSFLLDLNPFILGVNDLHSSYAPPSVVFCQ